MISTTGEYALRAAVLLAQNPTTPMTAAVIAKRTLVPQGYLSKILQSMVKAELISSQRGLHGGFVLAKPAQEISVLDVLASVDAAPERIKKCPLGIPGHVRLCAVHKMLDEAIASTEKAFSSTDIDTLCKSTRGIKALCDPE